MRSDHNKFPQTFLWGTATSSHQIEGNNQANDWWDWEQAGKTGDPSGIACDSYRRFEEDFDIAQKLHHNAHRLSIEWSRVEPRMGEWDSEALRHYQQVLKALRRRALEPIITLHHFTNPQWFSKVGGWENPHAPMWFERYATKIAQILGGDVEYWITFNEQNVLCYKGYIEGEWPPGKRSVRAAYRATLHIAQAHIRAYNAIKSVYVAGGWKVPQVGLAQHCLHAVPSNPSSWRDRFAAWFRKFMNNYFFLDLLQHDQYAWLPMLLGFGGKMKTLDFVGINYYFREIIQSAKWALHPVSLAGEVDTAHPEYVACKKNDLNWCIHPPGIGKVIREAHERYQVPVIITENGICTHDEQLREEFIVQHLQEVKRCIDDGLPVFGYMHWSLLDNFEWSIGYSPRFGLVAIDPTTQNRTIKSSAWVYADICKNYELPNARDKDKIS